MSKLNNVRRMYVLGDSGVGKTTLIDTLVSKTRMVPNSSGMSFESVDQTKIIKHVFPKFYTENSSFLFFFF